MDTDSLSICFCYDAGKRKTRSPGPLANTLTITPMSSIYQLIGLAGRVFANDLGDLSSIPGCVIPKTLKMVLDTSLLNTQHYEVRIKGEVEQSSEKRSTLPTPRCSSYRKGSFWVALDNGHQFYLLIFMFNQLEEDTCSKKINETRQKMFQKARLAIGNKAKNPNSTKDKIFLKRKLTN